MRAFNVRIKLKLSLDNTHDVTILSARYPLLSFSCQGADHGYQSLASTSYDPGSADAPERGEDPAIEAVLLAVIS